MRHEDLGSSDRAEVEGNDDFPVNRGALGSVPGIVGAGGNAGVVAFGFLFRIESLATEQALMLVGIAVIAVAALVFAVKFSPARGTEWRTALESALASRENRTIAGAAAD